MPAGPRHAPFEGTDRLIVDGTNLLYRIGAGAGGAAPPSAVVGRIRAAVPLTVSIDLVFDGVGHGVFGRLAQNMLVRWSGRRTADETILDLVSEAAMQGTGPAAAARVLVVTNDRALRDQVAAKGARSAALQWLISRLDLPAPAEAARSAPRPATGAARSAGSGGATPTGRRATIGHGRGPGGAGAQGGNRSDDGEARRGWKPGRGATAKTGTPRKVARHKRHPAAGA